MTNEAEALKTVSELETKDVTGYELKQATKALDELESRYAELFEYSGLGDYNGSIGKQNIDDIRKALQEPEPTVVSVKDIGRDITDWRFNDKIERKFGNYLADKYPDGVIVKENK